MALSLFGLYACGGDTATPTPIPPTATPVPPTPTPQAAKDATSSEVSLIQETLANTGSLQSYHFTMDVAPSDFITQPIKAEGDYVAPDTTYIKGTMGGQNIEEIVVGGKVFEKGADGKWTEKQPADTSNSDPTQMFNPDAIASSGNPLQGLGSLFESIKTYKNEGTETMDGKQVTKYSFKLDLAEMAGGQPMPEGLNLSSTDLGSGAVWIDPTAKNLHKLQIQLNLGPLMEMLTQAFSGMLGTPTPGGPQPTPFPQMAVNLSMTVSKHNDPSIKIPLTDEMKQAQSEPTPEAFPTMEEVATPEEAATPEGEATAGTSGQEVTGKIGEAVTAGDVVLTINDVKRSSTGTLPPSSGNEYLILDTTVENKGTQEVPMASLLNFKLVDSSGNELSTAFGADFTNQFDKAVSAGMINPGSKVTGELAYEVKQGDKDLTLRFVPNILDDKTVVVVKIDQ